jgi:hypothetical protein
MVDDAARWRRREYRSCMLLLARPVEDRAAFLVRACSGDSDLRREAASLLERDGHADRFLNTQRGCRRCDRWST